MLNFDIYTICTTCDEYHTLDNEAFLSFEDAMANRKNYSNWCCKEGDVYIRRYSEGEENVETWHISADGEILSHYK